MALNPLADISEREWFVYFGLLKLGGEGTGIEVFERLGEPPFTKRPSLDQIRGILTRLVLKGYVERRPDSRPRFAEPTASRSRGSEIKRKPGAAESRFKAIVPIEEALRPWVVNLFDRILFNEPEGLELVRSILAERLGAVSRRR